MNDYIKQTLSNVTKHLNPVNTLVEGYNMVNNAIGPASYSKNLPEPGLVDNSLDFFGGKITSAAKPVKVAKKAIAKEAPSSLLNSERGTNFRRWADGEKTEIMYRGEDAHYKDMLPMKHTMSKHNVDGKYFTTDPKKAARYAGPEAGGNTTQVHGRTGKLLEWSERNTIPLTKEVGEKYKQYGTHNKMRLSLADEMPQDVHTQLLQDMGYSGIRSGDEIAYFDYTAYKATNNSGAFSKYGNLMNAAIPASLIPLANTKDSKSKKNKK